MAAVAEMLRKMRCVAEKRCWSTLVCFTKYLRLIIIIDKSVLSTASVVHQVQTTADRNLQTESCLFPY